MAYIGKQPVVGNFVKLDAITTSATTTFNLLNGGVSYFPQTANNCIVSLNGVIQSPTSAYTISGSTIVFSDALTSSDTIDFILVLGDVLSIGTPSDGTITSAKLASGVSGLIAWQSVQTTGFTAVAGRGYPCNTTSAGFTVTLPSSPSLGDQVLLLDYAGTFDTNALTINPNSNKLEGGTANLILSGDREGVTLTYIDSTQGWLATSGIQEGTDALSPQVYSVEYLVVAGGGGAGGVTADASGGGGAGGLLTSTVNFQEGTTYTVEVGAGGAGGAAGGANNGTNGVNSSISGTGLTTITAIGGGFGARGDNSTNTTSGGSGGSGGGGSNNTAGGSGTSGQGNAGGTDYGGGGGQSAAGTLATFDGTNNAGAGLNSSITGSSVGYAGGGNSGGNRGATFGGGVGEYALNADNNTAGTANTGGGGGGAWHSATNDGKGGGSGIVILRMLASDYSGTTTGSPTVTDDGSYKVVKFTGNGTYTG